MSLSDIITQDIAAIFSGDYAIQATHDNGPVNETFNVIFDRPAVRALENFEPVQSNDPFIYMAAADAANVDKNSQFTISGTVYYVRTIENNHQGILKIFLTED